jgi:hypothetical protein
VYAEGFRHWAVSAAKIAPHTAPHEECCGRRRQVQCVSGVPYKNLAGQRGTARPDPRSCHRYSFREQVISKSSSRQDFDKNAVKTQRPPRQIFWPCKYARNASSHSLYCLSISDAAICPLILSSQPFGSSPPNPARLETTHG